jgi:hypothetical protein
MRQLMAMTFLAAAAAMGLLMVSLPARAQYAHCLPARGCVPTTQASYNACYQLALRRGWVDSDNAPKGGVGRRLDQFIYECLTGRIPR